MPRKTWRDIARDVVVQIRKENPDASGSELRRILRDNYPFGQRRWHPYKVWCEEVNKACGTLSTPAGIKNYWVNMERGSA